MNQQTFNPTDEQRDIIEHDGSVFVNACPGSGKTRVMVERARHLFHVIKSGRGVAFLSFTKSAIFELDQRLRQEGLLSSPVFPNFIGTFDSFVWQFLVGPFGIRGCDAHPRLIPDINNTPVKLSEKSQPLPLSCFCPKTGDIINSEAKRKGFDISKKRESLIRAYKTAATSIRARLREHGCLGFDEARLVALERIKEQAFSGMIADVLRGRFCEIIVDEAQDCNPEDLTIITWLRDSGLSVKIVCDINQSIYEFRGGVTKHLLDFSETFPTEQRKKLTGNFRSTPNICKSIAQFRPKSTCGIPDRALGSLNDEGAPVLILSYSDKSVPSSIGTTYTTILEEADIDVSSARIVAATKASGAAAVGQPRPDNSNQRTVQFAKAITDFHFPSDFSDIKNAIECVHRIILEIEGYLENCTYHQYLVDNEIEPVSYRPKIISIIKALRFDPTKYACARDWYKSAKNLLDCEVSIKDGKSIAQKLRWDRNLDAAFVTTHVATVMPRTIHSVKGMEYPAICVVTTPPTLKGILDFLEKGEPADKAEGARKLYVAASRAKELLVIAAPEGQAKRLQMHLSGQGADVTKRDI
ncbi:MAG: ATP-dependent helicase [Ectothiorhodospiraceae bacterium AqS1]|nr:ATP-dependent helicase [Ectothiorhodospiraceae bacterium AqS1]